MDGGTLFQLRNFINRRNVKKDTSDNANACEDFFLTVTEGHILAATTVVHRVSARSCVSAHPLFFAVLRI